VQEDPIADAYCTVPAFRWKSLFYPELKMPHMPVSDAKGVARGKTMESLEHAEAESAMVCLPLSTRTYAMPALDCHVCLPFAQPMAMKKFEAEMCEDYTSIIRTKYLQYSKTILTAHAC
jgi:hypothetical protein